MATVQIEFAGLVVAAVPKDAMTAKKISVMLLDVRAVGGPEHSAVMLVKDVPGLRGVPDFTITRPSDGKTDPVEYAGWILRGEVEFSGGFDAFAAPDLAKTMDLKMVSGATDLVSPKRRPLTATVVIEAGKLRSSGTPHHFDFLWLDNATPPADQRIYGLGKEVELTDRMTWELGDVKESFQASFTRADGSRCVVTIPHDVGEPIMISNLVGGVGKGAPHFDAFYTLAVGTQTPRIQRYNAITGVKLDPPENPDECRPATFVLP